MNKKSPKTAKHSAEKPAPLKPEVDHSFDYEVTQDLRQEQAAEFFRKYGLIVALLLVAVIASVAWYQWQLREQQSLNAMASVPFEQYLNDPKQETVSLDDKATGYKLLAEFAEAGKSAQNADIEEAIKQYLAIINDPNVPDIYQQQAAVMAGYATLQSEKLPEGLMSHLTDIETSTSSWQYLAREVLSLNALKNNNIDEASAYLLALTEDNNAPQSIRSRASELLPLAAQ